LNFDRRRAKRPSGIRAGAARLPLPAQAGLPREAGVNKETISNALQEFVTVFFLAAGPPRGAAITLTWLLGVALGLVAVLTR